MSATLAAEVLARAEQTLELLTSAKAMAYAAIAVAECLATSKEEQARAAFLAGGEVTGAMLGHISAARVEAEFFRRTHKSLDLDIAAARVTLAIAQHEAAVADAAAAAAELDHHQQLTSAALRAVAELEGGEVHASIDGAVSAELRERIAHYSQLADTSAAQIIRRRQELGILQEQRGGQRLGL